MISSLQNDRGLQELYSDISIFSGICDVNISTTNGVIASPNYPKHYSQNMQCTWLIDLGPGYDVTLSFYDFELEETKECSFDYVLIQEGNTAQSIAIGQFCSSTVPPVQSTNGPMRVSFVSDKDGQMKGFTAVFMAQGLRVLL